MIKIETFSELTEALSNGREIHVSGDKSRKDLRPNQGLPETEQLFKNATRAGWTYWVK